MTSMLWMSWQHLVWLGVMHTSAGGQVSWNRKPGRAWGVTAVIRLAVAVGASHRVLEVLVHDACDERVG
jgi:hypothetical protein